MNDEEYETQIRANDIYIMDKMQEEIDQLTNNWNELEEWLKDLFEKGYDIKLVLDKMKEMQNGSDDE